MKTTIDNNQRIFYIVTTTGRTAVCNLGDLNTVIADMQVVAGYYTIYHIWNHKLKKVTKKLLKGMFEGVRITQTFTY